MTAAEKLRRIAAEDAKRADSLSSSGNRRTRGAGKAWRREAAKLAEVALELETA